MRIIKLIYSYFYIINNKICKFLTLILNLAYLDCFIKISVKKIMYYPFMLYVEKLHRIKSSIGKYKILFYVYNLYSQQFNTILH